ncbi:MAG TPA: hypothetical protein PKW57_03760 [Anaerolineaceae bacterium]|jgi:hypothetical protein|nr:hypothetical protein [Anaerolineaceae bacterium]HPS32596.1 hypothetical protein [Anaerolineaceae bacterium]
MPIADDLSHYASIVSWKVKQQTQILHVQAQIHELESQIGIQKTVLGEQTYDLFSQGALTEEPIRQICEKITELMAQKAERQKELELLRSQTPPDKPQSAAPEEAAPAQPQEGAGEWVAPENVSEPAPPAEPGEQSGEWVEPGINTAPPTAPTEE